MIRPLRFRNYRQALGPRAGQKVLSLRTVPGRDEKTMPARCAEAHGFSLHAASCVVGRISAKALERLCRYITRPAIANERLARNGAGDVVLQLKRRARPLCQTACRARAGPAAEHQRACARTRARHAEAHELKRGCSSASSTSTSSIARLVAAR